MWIILNFTGTHRHHSNASYRNKSIIIFLTNKCQARKFKDLFFVSKYMLILAAIKELRRDPYRYYFKKKFSRLYAYPDWDKNHFHHPRYPYGPS